MCERRYASSGVNDGYEQHHLPMRSFTDFFVKWYAGKVKDLHAGLVEVDKSIDSKMKQAQKGGGGVP